MTATQVKASPEWSFPLVYRLGSRLEFYDMTISHLVHPFKALPDPSQFRNGPSDPNNLATPCGFNDPQETPLGDANELKIALTVMRNASSKFVFDIISSTSICVTSVFFYS